MTGLFLSMVLARATVAGPAGLQFEPLRCANHSLAHCLLSKGFIM